MEIKKRFVVVGTGSIGIRHARLLCKRENITVELCDPNPEGLKAALKETGDLPCHTSFGEMLATVPDMVLVATPHEWHTRQTIKAIEVGAHVLCEKPMSDRLDTALALASTAMRKDQVLAYGFSNHFHPAIIKIKHLIEKGHLGEVLYAHFHVGTYGTLVNSISRYQSTMESALLLDYVHQPDLLYWILGKSPKGVYAMGSKGGGFPLISNPNSMTLLLDYDGPLTSSIHLNYLQYPDRYHYEFIGDKGWIYYDLITDKMTYGVGKDRETTEESFAFERDDIYVAEHQAFLDAVDGKSPPESSAKDALQSMILFDAAIRSWKTKQRIELDHTPS